MQPAVTVLPPGSGQQAGPASGAGSLGNDDNSAMDKVTGGGLPAEIFRDFLSQAGPILAKINKPTQTVSRVVSVASAPKPSENDDTHVSQPAVSPTQTSVSSKVIRGIPEVLDTGTLVIAGQPLRLEGVASERGTPARQLARFLRRREIMCADAQTSDVQRCQIDGEDLSEIIIGAGGARASPDAPAHLLAAENQARSARIGIWRRQR